MPRPGVAAPQWNTDGTNRTAPSAGEEAVGHAPNSTPSSSIENHIKHYFGAWLQHLAAELQAVVDDDGYSDEEATDSTLVTALNLMGRLAADNHWTGGNRFSDSLELERSGLANPVHGQVFVDNTDDGSSNVGTVVSFVQARTLAEQAGLRFIRGDITSSGSSPVFGVNNIPEDGQGHIKLSLMVELQAGSTPECHEVWLAFRRPGSGTPVFDLVTTAGPELLAGGSPFSVSGATVGSSEVQIQVSMGGSFRLTGWASYACVSGW